MYEEGECDNNGITIFDDLCNWQKLGGGETN